MIILLLVLRWWLKEAFWVPGSLFIAYLIWNAIMEVKEKEFGWSRGMATAFWIFLTWILMAN